MTSNIIPFTEITARATEAEQQEQTKGLIQGLEEIKRRNTKELIESLSEPRSYRTIARLLDRLTTILYADARLAEIEAETNSNATKPKSKGGAVKRQSTFHLR